MRGANAISVFSTRISSIVAKVFAAILAVVGCWLLLVKATSLLSLLQITDIVRGANLLGAPNFSRTAGVIHPAERIDAAESRIYSRLAEIDDLVSSVREMVRVDDDEELD